MSYKLALSGLCVVVAVVVYRIQVYEPPTAPTPDDTWLGAGEARSADEAVREFRIQWDQEMIEDLKHRLRNRRVPPPPLEGVNFTYGFNRDTLEPILDYWLLRYNFTERLDIINSYPQFITNIQGLDIHFIRVTPKAAPGTRVLPLLLLHGWPGSVLEFRRLVPLLTQSRKLNGAEVVFEVIAPSLPGFGYSDVGHYGLHFNAPARPGMRLRQISTVLRTLMQRIGHRRYYIQGGDYGSVVGMGISTMFPEDVLGYHTNMPYSKSLLYYAKVFLGGVLPWVVEPVHHHKLYPLSKWFDANVFEMGYRSLQSTKPDTIGVSLSDSPGGLAAWILEKISTGTNGENRNRSDGGLSLFPPEDLIDLVMMYWAPNKMTTSMRYYKEFKHDTDSFYDVPSSVPTWAAHAPNELLYQPVSLMRHKFTRILGISQLAAGGHFLAMEQPSILAEDIWIAVEAFEQFWMKRLRG